MSAAFSPASSQMVMLAVAFTLPVVASSLTLLSLATLLCCRPRHFEAQHPFSMALYTASTIAFCISGASGLASLTQGDHARVASGVFGVIAIGLREHSKAKYLM